MGLEGQLFYYQLFSLHRVQANSRDKVIKFHGVSSRPMSAVTLFNLAVYKVPRNFKSLTR